MWGCRVLGFQVVGMPGCRELEVVAFWGAGIRTAGRKHLQRSPERTGEAADGKGGHAVGRLLAQAQLAQQLPHHRRQFEPVACGEEKLGATRPCPGCYRGGPGAPRLPEKPAPMTMLLCLGCRSRMKSPSGVFCGVTG